jgi:uroporphyrin-III C-methyltransferase/precorrin-2 dehydrogenase/sirohydrochlorin ferrochelatase
MGVAALETIGARLTSHGRSGGTPVAIIENGSRADQRVTLTTLGELDHVAHAGGIRSPALVIVGEVAALAASLRWFGDAPRTLGALSAAA